MLTSLIRVRYGGAWTWTSYQKRRKIVQSENFKNMFTFYQRHFVLYRNNFLRTLRLKPHHCVKSVCIWTYSGPHFFHIWAEYREILGNIIQNMGKMQTRITPFYTVLVRLRLYPAQFSFNYFVRNLY